MRYWLKQIRLEKGLDQKKVARLIGKTPACYCSIEKGVRNPTVKLAKAIANVLEFDWTLFYQDMIN